MKSMKTRYTYKQMCLDCEEWNKKLAEYGRKYRFVPGHRYNYSAIDLATPEQLKAHIRQRNLETGTPRECREAALEYIAFGD